LTAGPIAQDRAPRGWVIDASVTMPWFFPDESTPVTTLDRLAATHGLSAYDAAYLELALRRSLTLVSLDARLVAAAHAIGHPVMTSTDA